MDGYLKTTPSESAPTILWSDRKGNSNEYLRTPHFTQKFACLSFQTILKLESDVQTYVDRHKVYHLPKSLTRTCGPCREPGYKGIRYPNTVQLVSFFRLRPECYDKILTRVTLNIPPVLNLFHSRDAFRKTVTIHHSEDL